MSVVDHEPAAATASVCAVIVTFHPDSMFLERLVRVVASSVSEVLLVANDRAPPSFALPSNVTTDIPEGNLGLGAAYNRAARWAVGRNASHLLLLDQDSLPNDGMVAALVRAIVATENVAAVGPLWRDRRTGADGFFVQLNRWGVQKIAPADNTIVPVDFLISSGSLISLSALASVGNFDEDLFIEHVDTDWCLRARAAGWKLCGVSAARLDHEFGEQSVMPFTFSGGRQLYLYPPQRNYHLLRNSLILWRRPHAAWPWIIHDLCRTIQLMVFYALFVPPRVNRLKWMWRALRDAYRRT